MKIILILLTCFGFCISANAQKQSRLITGMVVSESDNRPIEGALIWVKGSRNYSGTQTDGVYFVQVNPTDTSIRISYRDFDPVEVKLTGETEYNVLLKRSSMDPSYAKPGINNSTSTKLNSRR